MGQHWLPSCLPKFNAYSCAKAALTHFKDQLCSKWQLSDLGDTSFCVGITIEHCRKAVFPTIATANPQNLHWPTRLTKTLQLFTSTIHHNSALLPQNPPISM
ncbi:hypothetical protein PAXRUDRAFT_175384 [Paxillus rubicundulus Ve08.2h10]|uniref:Uncharacterized protein n=1 Tax=Paxillus rubicundulus Ve08.2h10 TaxID=930991 RepID=A0A0D0DBD4_9AGAM|nr:hypothetical protein PAXRUDRAFT_175384 [Paxillus rubicundulus Ve08.2h10]